MIEKPDFWQQTTIEAVVFRPTWFQMAGLWLFYAFFISNLSAYVWKASGNGIIPHLNVPVRTVFIQIYEDDGETPVDARDLEERKLIGGSPHKSSKFVFFSGRRPSSIQI